MSKNEAIAPDLLKSASEAGMDAGSFDPSVISFMTGGVCGPFKLSLTLVLEKYGATGGGA